MTGDVPEKHLLAGLDERARGFSRVVEVETRDGAFRAIFRYEALALESAGAESPAAALSEMVRLLQERGCRQLRTRLVFVGGVYLGSQELWVEYPDPEPAPAGRLVDLLRRTWRALTRRSSAAS